MYTFHCPHCSTPLRTRDRKLLGREIVCPDCRRPMRLIADGPEGLAAEKVETADDVPVPVAASPETTMPLPVSAGSWKTAVWDGLRSPVGVAWSVAACLLLVMVVALWPERESTRTATVEAAPERVERRLVEPVQAEPIEAEVPSGGIEQTSPEPPPTQPSDPADEPPAVTDAPPLADVPLAANEEPEGQSPAIVPEAVPIPPDSPPVRRIDVAAALQQPILAFQQAKAVPARELLLVIEELAGVPIRYDVKQLEEELNRAIALELHDTSVAEILETVTAKLGTRYVLEADGIRLDK